MSPNNQAAFLVAANVPLEVKEAPYTRPRQNELLDRISRLESIVGKANPEKLAELDGILSGEGGGGGGSSGGDGDAVTKSQQPQSKARSSSGQAVGAGTVMTKSASRYGFRGQASMSLVLATDSH